MSKQELKGRWWEFWRRSFDFRANRDHLYFPIMSTLLAPCHEDWWYLQSQSLNDNDPP